MMNFRKKALPIYTYGASVLKMPAAPIAVVTPEIRELAMQMIDTMFTYDGIGLAAPQVGVGLRLVVFGLSNDKPKTGERSPGEDYLLPMMPIAVINPQIVAFSNERTVREEGCLSVPDVWAPVERPIGVVFEAKTIDGEDFRVECQGLLARCVQHELDHLDGQLFIDRVTPEEFRKIKPEVDELLREGQENNFIRRQPK